jgi:hypothetical protein
MYRSEDRTSRSEGPHSFQVQVSVSRPHALLDEAATTRLISMYGKAILIISNLEGTLVLR